MQWKGVEIASLSRAFLDTNGASKHATVQIAKKDLSALSESLYGSLREMAADLRTASRRGLVERFDGSIGTGSVLMPFGGKTQRTPAQAMAAVLPTLPGQVTDQGSVMAWGMDPDHMCMDPYTGAHAAIYSSVAKLVAAGADYKKVYLSLQEFFERLRNEPTRWGKPFAALLGALDAQMELGAAAIGGKDSMSGSFMDYDVPPTLISFAIAPIDQNEVLTPEFKEADHPVYVFGPTEPTAESRKAAWERFHALHKAGKVKAGWAVEYGLGEAVMKMSFGNSIGFVGCKGMDDLWHQKRCGVLVAELTEEVEMPGVVKIGWTIDEPVIDLNGDTATIEELLALNEGVLEKVYPTKVAEKEAEMPVFGYTGGCSAAPAVKVAKPKVLIPVFPGTNCEFDSARAMVTAGAEPEIFVVRNLSAEDVSRSVEQFAASIADSQMIFIPGGFSGGDEPDGSAKFITAFFRNPAIKEQVTKLLEDRDGLMLGICNGFQALIKLGLVPYGKIIDTDENCPTLTYNTIARHQSKLVRTRVCTNKSPWLAGTEVGEIHTVPISHGEGRFFCSEELALQLAANGQIATQYVDLEGNPSMDTAFNPNGSVFAIEGITSPDGRVLGKMGHSERWQRGLYRNVPGEYDMKLFASAVKYFK